MRQPLPRERFSTPTHNGHNGYTGAEDRFFTHYGHQPSGKPGIFCETHLTATTKRKKSGVNCHPKFVSVVPCIGTFLLPKSQA